MVMTVTDLGSLKTARRPFPKASSPSTLSSTDTPKAVAMDFFSSLV